AGAVAGEAPALEHGQTFGRAEPEAARPILVDGGHGMTGRGGLFARHPPPLPEPPKSAAARADPQAAVGALVQRAHVLERAVFGVGGRLERPDDPALETSHASRRRPDPERAVSARAEREDARVAKARRVPAVEDGEADAVEADQPAQASDPQVAVARLRDGLNELLGQAVPGQPD